MQISKKLEVSIDFSSIFLINSLASNLKKIGNNGKISIKIIEIAGIHWFRIYNLWKLQESHRHVQFQIVNKIFPKHWIKLKIFKNGKFSLKLFKKLQVSIDFSTKIFYETASFGGGAKLPKPHPNAYL